MTAKKTDICVIGAGSGGLSVAAAVSAFGVPVTLIENHKMGGDCLNYGCVPSKAILAAGKTAQTMREAGKFGIEAVSEPKVNFGKVHDHVHKVIGAIAPTDSVERFTGLGVDVITGRARFVDKGALEVDGQRIEARRFVVATGSSPLIPPIQGLDTVDYFTNETLFDNKRKIGHLVIIGGGPIGMEMAQAHRRLGAKVSVVEGDRAFAKDDPEAAAIVLENLRREGVEIFEGTKVKRVSKRGKTGVTVHCERDGADLHMDGTHLLLATGRKPNVDDMGLEKAGVDYDKRGIKVDGGLRTTNKKIYAIGDVTGGLQFTHVAGWHAGLVVRPLLFRLPGKPDNTIVPWVTYTDPELAQVGITEDQARQTHGTISVLRWPYHENDRAQAERKQTGFIKVILDRKSRPVGVTIVGTQAGEIANFWSLAIANKLKLSAITKFVSPYPTLSEIGKRAATSHYAPMARKPMVRNVVNFLRRFG